MVKSVIKLGSVKRFGPRYGRRLKERLAKIEQVQHSKHKCPYCRALKAKRLAAGIWTCDKCGSKFTGKAYSIKKIKIPKEEKDESTETSEEEIIEKGEEEEKGEKYKDPDAEKEKPDYVQKDEDFIPEEK